MQNDPSIITISIHIDIITHTKYRVSIKADSIGRKLMNPIAFHQMPAGRSEWLYFGSCTDVAMDFFSSAAQGNLVPFTKATEALYAKV